MTDTKETAPDAGEVVAKGDKRFACTVCGCGSIQPTGARFPLLHAMR